MKSGEPLAPTMTVQAARKRLDETQRNAWPVGDPGRVIGVITRPKLDEVKDGDMRLSTLMDPTGTWPYLHPDHRLSYALERMGMASADTLPVVSRANRNELAGIVTLPDLLAIFGVAKDKA